MTLMEKLEQLHSENCMLKTQKQALINENEKLGDKLAIEKQRVVDLQIDLAEAQGEIVQLKAKLYDKDAQA